MWSMALVRKYKVESYLVLGGLFVASVYIALQWVRLQSHQYTPVDGVVPENGIYVNVLGVPFDDVYIHCRYAYNILHGSSFSFNPGETLTADTSPLWVALIAISGLVTSRLEFVAVFLSLLCYLLIAPGMYRVARDLLKFSEQNAQLAGWTTVFAARNAWSAVAGMETALAILLMLLVVEEHIRSRQIGSLRSREAVWLGLGLFVRPEFMFVGFVLAADWVYLVVTEKADISRAPLTILLLVAIASPGVLLPVITRNSLLAHSSVVQGAGITFPPSLAYIWRAGEVLGSNNLPAFLLFVLGAILLRKDRRYWVPFAIVIGLPLLQSVVAPQGRHHLRYIFPILPWLVVLGIATWEEMERRYTISAGWKRAVPILLLIAAVIETGRWAAIESSDVRNINDQHLAITAWLRANMRPTDTLAVDDVGAFGYLLDKPVIDLTGLMTPDIYKMHDQDSVWRYARAHGATIFIIYKQMNPELYLHHKDSLVLQHDYQVRLPHTSAAGMYKSVFRVREAGIGH